MEDGQIAPIQQFESLSRPSPVAGADRDGRGLPGTRRQKFTERGRTVSHLSEECEMEAELEPRSKAKKAQNILFREIF